MTDIGSEIAVEAIVEGFMAMVLLTVATTTISYVEPREIERQRVLEEEHALSKGVAIWQTMF